YLGKVPKAVIPILEKALQKEVEDRYPNVTTMVGDLLPLQEELDEPMSEEVAAAIRESVPPPSRATTLKKKKKDPLKQTASIRPKPTKKITPKKAAPPKTKGPLAKANQSTKGNKTVLGVPPVKPKSAAQLKKTPALPLSARPIKNQTPKPIPKIPAPTPSPHPPTGSETAEKKNSKLKVDNSSGGSGVSPDGRGLSESSKSMSEFRSPGGDIPLPEQQEDQAKLTTPKPKSGGTPPPLPVVPVSPPAEEAIIEPTFDELVAEEGAPLLTARATPLVRAISWLAQKRPRPVRAQETIEWVSKNRKKAATIGGSAAALFFIAMAIILAAGQENGIVAPSKLQASTLRESPPSSLESTAAPEPVGASKTATPQTENESTPPDPARVNEAENKTDETIIPDNEHTTAVESEIPEVEKTKRPNRSWKKKRKRSRRRKNKSAEVKLPGSLASNPFGK
ncbi:MAG: hypothetical protein GY859_31515, partial [Desulfobacterales bacterium]|nr:hypothetical protein [Desulfobacterales bacterium]